MLAIDPIIHDLKKGNLVRKHPTTYQRKADSRMLFFSQTYEETDKDMNALLGDSSLNDSSLISYTQTEGGKSASQPKKSKQQRNIEAAIKASSELQSKLQSSLKNTITMKNTVNMFRMAT